MHAGAGAHNAGHRTQGGHGQLPPGRRPIPGTAGLARQGNQVTSMPWPARHAAIRPLSCCLGFGDTWGVGGSQCENAAAGREGGLGPGWYAGSQNFASCLKKYKADFWSCREGGSGWYAGSQNFARVFT